jgi:hypothetical protein
MEAFKGMHFVDFANSRAATRLNGLMGGAVNEQMVLDELDLYTELTEEGREIIKKRLEKKKNKFILF